MSNFVSQLLNAANQPLVDPKTGKITREWMRFFESSIIGGRVPGSVFSQTVQINNAGPTLVIPILGDYVFIAMDRTAAGVALGGTNSAAPGLTMILNNISAGVGFAYPVGGSGVTATVTAGVSPRSLTVLAILMGQ